MWWHAQVQRMPRALPRPVIPLAAGRRHLPQVTESPDWNRERARPARRCRKEPSIADTVIRQTENVILAARVSRCGDDSKRLGLRDRRYGENHSFEKIHRYQYGDKNSGENGCHGQRSYLFLSGGICRSL